MTLFIRRVLVTLALFSLLAGPALAARSSSDTIRPGLWESRNKVSFPINDETVTRQCITPEKVEQFLSGPSTKNFRCTYARSVVGGGTVSAQGECVDKNGLQSKVDVKGSYTPTTFKLGATLTINLGGLPIPINASTEAILVSEVCPADTH